MDTTTEQTDPKDDNDKFGTYRDAFKIYENGKHRRYTLLFSVNGAVAAIAKLYPSTGLDRLSGCVLTLFMIVFTGLMWHDIRIFGSRMRKAVGDDEEKADVGIFSIHGKFVLTACCVLIAVGWLLVAL